METPRDNLGDVVQRGQGLVDNYRPFDSFNHIVGEAGQGGRKGESIELVVAFSEIDDEDPLELRINVVSGVSKSH